MSGIRRSLTEKLIEMLTLKGGELVLDLATGTGRVARPLSKQIKGGIADKPMPMDISNVMILTAGGVPTRIAYKLETVGGKVRRVRIARKGGETLERR